MYHHWASLVQEGDKHESHDENISPTVAWAAYARKTAPMARFQMEAYSSLAHGSETGDRAGDLHVHARDDHAVPRYCLDVKMNMTRRPSITGDHGRGACQIDGALLRAEERESPGGMSWAH